MESTILENFLSLCAIPHKSHHEEAISRYLYGWAQKKNLTAYRDEVGNVIIEKPGTKGFENAPCTILQAHMDMVVVWEDGKVFDPLRDPIVVVDDGKTLRGLGTSLGGDDGAGVALSMSILEDEEAVHGPIRAIFTVDEEDGMSGADALDAKYLNGKYMINLDWEEFGSLCCSSAGSDMYRFTRECSRSACGDGLTFTVTAQGLTGGHSGSEIHHGRANAIRELVGILAAAEKAGVVLRLVSLKGGSAHNAIPSRAAANVFVPMADVPLFLSVAESESMVRRSQYFATDPTAEYTVEQASENAADAISVADTAACLAIMSTIYNGIHTMSQSIPGLVESSSNLGLATLDGKGMDFVVHQRSSEPSITADMKADFEKKAEENGFTMTVLSSSPAWPLKAGSKLVEICKGAYTELFGKEISVEPVHAGLECGAFSRSNPSLDIISIGPDIPDIHSTRETLVLETVYNCDALVRRMLKEIAERG